MDTVNKRNARAVAHKIDDRVDKCRTERRVPHGIKRMKQICRRQNKARTAGRKNQEQKQLGDLSTERIAEEKRNKESEEQLDRK